MTNHIFPNLYPGELVTRRPDNVTPLDSPAGRTAMVQSRLNTPGAPPLPFQHFNTALTDSEVIVFLVVKNEPVVLRDERNMYPSDGLITQLRLLI